MQKDIPNIWPLRIEYKENKKATQSINPENKTNSKHSIEPDNKSIYNNTQNLPNNFKKNKKTAKRKSKYYIQFSEVTENNPTDFSKFGEELFHQDSIDIIETQSFLLHLPNLSILPLFSGYQINNLEKVEFEPAYYPNETIELLNLPADLFRLCLSLRIKTIKQLLSYNGFELARLSSIHTLLSLREKVLSFYFGDKYQNKKFLWSTFEENIYQLLRLITEEENRNVIMVIEKLKGRTLESIGQQFGLTRERVRQIVKRALIKINLEANKYFDELYWFTHSLLQKNFGIISTRNLASALKNTYLWKYLPPFKLLNYLCSCNKKLFGTNEKENWIYLISSKCLYCQELSNKISFIIKNQRYVHIQDVIPEITSFCNQCDMHGEHEIPEELIHFHIKNFRPQTHQTDDVEQFLISKQSSRVKHGSIIASAITFLRNYGKPIHFTELSRQLREINHEKFSDHNVHSSLNLSEEALLWDKGTFVHIDCITFPEELIKEVEQWLIEYLHEIEDYPCVSVYGALHKFEKPLAEYNIKTAQALYSCLRVSNHLELGYPRYPYVHLSSKPYTTPYVFTEQFILQAKNWMKLKDIIHTLKEIMLLEETHAFNITKSVANCIIDDDYNYIHIKNINFNSADIAELINKCLLTLESIDNVSANKLYTDHQKLCNRMSITGPKMLFTFLQNYASHIFNLTCYPQVWPKERVFSRKVKNLSRQLNEYVAQFNRPFTFEEIKKEFCDIKGYNPKSVYQWFIFNKNLFTYDGNWRIHKSFINWTPEKQSLIESLAKEYYQKSVNQYGFSNIKGFIESYFDKLPLLPQNYQWTTDLMHSILNNSTKIQVFGSARNAFAVIPNDYEVFHLEDVVVNILHLHYKGKAPLDEISNILQKLEVQKNKLSPAVICRTPNLHVKNNEVSLTIYSM